jgi:Chromo (CHRromatin Organisation MOdifier) domain
LINRTDPVSGIIEKAAVEKIMAKRMNPRKRENEYLVKWEAKPQTWEPASHLDTCKDLIENFEVLLAKQKEMRSKSQQQAQPHASQPVATSTPTSVAATTPNRPVRFSKEKAINQVKQWTGGNKHQDDSAESSGKRKLEEEDEFDEEMDGDDVDDEDYELESSWEKKKMAQQLGQTSVKRLKTDGQNGSIRMIQANKSGLDMQIGATVVRKVVGTKSPDVIMAGQKQQSGVFKKASPAAVVQKKPGEGQVRIVGSKDQVQSGIVRVGASTATPINKANIVSRVVPKASPAQQIRASPGTGTVVRTVQSVQNQQKTLAQKIIQRSPIASTKVQPAANRPVAQVVQRQQARSPATQIVRKPGTPQQVATNRRGQPIQQQSGRVIRKGTASSQHDEDDDGIPDPFPKDLPPIEADSESPPPLTLCPITGKVLGQAEGEPTAEEQEAEGESADQHQITQLLSNEDGTPIYITGDDGTMYQVAGKNANGETILISTNAEGEQTCVLLPADQDLLAGLPGIQTTDASEAIDGAPLTVDAAVAEAVSAAGEQADGEQFFSKEGDEGSQGSEEVTQPLSIAVGGDSDSQDGQITAEIVQADEPSPGKFL